MKRVLFLMSDTGGGHRAAAEAIRDAMFWLYGRQNLSVDLVDVYKECLFPLNYMPEFYPWWVNNGKLTWGVGYSLSNTRRSAAVLSSSMYLTSGHRLRRMARRHPADVVVSVHSVITRPSISAWMTLPQRPPFITVVTDLVSTHMFWYDRRAERTLVPTQAAYDRGIACGLREDRMRVTGLPVHLRFTEQDHDKVQCRYELGWDPNLPVIMLVAGGEGMGPLYSTSRALNAAELDCQLVIIAGKNAALASRLSASTWNQPTHIYGFVDDMPSFMAAADILVTKAGPATISEACISGLPMILSDAIPGQETGNVDHVIANNAGVYAPRPSQVVDAAAVWLADGPVGLALRSANARRIARPSAVWDIAQEVWEHAHRSQIETVNRRKFLNHLLEAPAGIFPTLT